MPNTAAAPGATTDTKFLGLGGKSITFNFGFSTMGQTTPNGCWYATIKMVYQWASENGKGVSPATVDTLLIPNVFADQNALTAALQSGLSAGQRSAVFAAVNMTTQDQSVPAGWSSDTIYAALQSNGPMVYTETIQNNDGTNNWHTHALVLNGFSSETSTPSVNYIDPFDGDPNGTPTGTADANVMALADFLTSVPPAGSMSGATAIAFLKS